MWDRFYLHSAKRKCLEKQFVNVHFSQTIRPTGVFHDEGTKRPWYSIFNGGVSSQLRF
jgi:hypothetical protein